MFARRLLPITVLFVGLLVAVPSQAFPVDEDPTANAPRVCVEPGEECYFVYGYVYRDCLVGYDADGDGDDVGYGCMRGIVGACTFEYPDGDGTTCVAVGMQDQYGDTCVLSYTTYEPSGYQQFVCFST